MDNLHMDQDLVNDLEQKIFAARNYVVPSDELRPRALGSAKASSQLIRNANLLVVATLLTMFVWSMLIPAVHALRDFREKLTRTHVEKIESGANSYPAEPRYDQRYEPSWGEEN